jgi:hypothetical protein
MFPTTLTRLPAESDPGPSSDAARSAGRTAAGSHERDSVSVEVPPGRRDRDGIPPGQALPPTLLEPIGEGIAGCPALWEPLLPLAVSDGPVLLVATEGYEVWLEVHPAGTSLRARRPGTTHAVAVARGSLRFRPAGVSSSAAVALAAGTTASAATAAVPTATDVVLTAPESAGAVAVHVHSPPGPRRRSMTAARLPRDVVSFLAHPARGGSRPAAAETSTGPLRGGRS